MCRDGFNIECEEPGCTARVTCRHEMGMCSDHGFERYLIDEDEPAFATGGLIGGSTLGTFVDPYAPCPPYPARWEGDDN